MGHESGIANFNKKSKSECLDWKIRKAERTYEFRGKSSCSRVTWKTENKMEG